MKASHSHLNSNSCNLQRAAFYTLFFIGNGIDTNLGLSRNSSILFYWNVSTGYHGHTKGFSVSQWAIWINIHAQNCVPDRCCATGSMFNIGDISKYHKMDKINGFKMPFQAPFCDNNGIGMLYIKYPCGCEVPCSTSISWKTTLMYLNFHSKLLGW